MTFSDIDIDGCVCFLPVHAKERVKAAGMRGRPRGRGGHQAPLLLQDHHVERFGGEKNQASV